MTRKKSYYLATVKVKGKPANVGFALEWPQTGAQISPQARTLAAIKFCLEDKGYGTPDQIGPAEDLDIQNLTIVYEHDI